MQDLYSAVRNSLHGLEVQQRKALITVRNLEHADDPKYNRLVAEVSNDGAGHTRVTQINRVVDEYVEKMRLSQGSVVGYAQVKSDYLNRVRDLFGKPGELPELKTESVATGLRDAVDDFFAKVQELANNPENYTLKEFVVSKAADLAHMVRSASKTLHSMREDAERKFADGVTLMNHGLKQLFDLNQSIASATQQDEVLAELQNQRDEVLLKLSEYLDVDIAKRGDGRIYVVTARGLVMTEDFLKEFKYDPTPGSVDKYDDLVLRYAHDDPSYVAGDVVIDMKHMKGGKLKALAELRDHDIPAAIDQLDSFANVFSKEINEVYSTGASYPGVSSLQSTNALARVAHLDFDGAIRIALLDKTGSAAVDLAGEPIRALTIEIADKTLGDVVDEINHYYDFQPNRVEFISGLRDLQLQNIEYTKSGILTMGLVADNDGAEDHVIAVRGAKVFYNDGRPGMGGKKVYLEQDLPPQTVEMEVGTGELKHSEDWLNLDLAALPTGADGFVVELDVIVDGARATVEYRSVGPDNKRLYATAVHGSGAVLVEQPGNQQYLRAELVNEKGARLTDSYRPGFLTLEVLDSAKHGLVIDALDSKKRFVEGKVNFIHDMGFNNLFKETEEVKDSAGDFLLNAAVFEEPHRLNVARLLPRPGSRVYDIGMGNGEVALELANLAHKRLMFPSTSYLPSLNSTFAFYTTEIGEHAAFKAYEADIKVDHASSFNKLLEDSHYNVSGVNIDEEVGKMLMIENYYLASNKGLATVRELLEEFLKAL